MITRRQYRVNVCSIAILAIAWLATTGVSAGDYVPFPGKIEVNLVRVESAKDVVVSFETWPGFARETTIELPGIAIPTDSARADTCERDMAAKSRAFTQQFVSEAKMIYVQDMRMETSADTTVFADIMSDQGSLIRALQAKGLARPESVPAKTSWCK